MEQVEASPVHIPYGILSPQVMVVTGAAAAPAVGWALCRVRRNYQERAVPVMGILGAYLFAAQMINFPVTAGTSGHLLGAALATFVLGPAPAVLVMTAVLVVQAVLFQDGAVPALGANILNMAVGGVFTAHLAMRLWTGTAARLAGGRPDTGAGDACRREPGGTRLALAGAGVAAFLSILFPAAACAAEVAASRVYPLPLVLGTMTGVHALIGIGEAAITMSILQFLYKVRPDLLAGLFPAGTDRAAGSRQVEAPGKLGS